MKTSLGTSELSGYVRGQINNFFPDNKMIQGSELEKYVSASLERVEKCFSKIKNKYFRSESQVLFNHLNGDQYAIFLYFLGNTVYRNDGDLTLASKIYLLNKAFHGLDAFYEVGLPDIFLLVHPLGTVLGRAKYSDYLVVYQRCGVGSNKNIYPSLGEYVTLHPGASVLGTCKVGNNCSMAAGSLLLDKDLGHNKLYIGNPKAFIIKDKPGKSHFWE